MSKPIRFDSLLVRDLAAELHATLAGAALRAVRFDRDGLTLELLSEAGRFAWALHPTRGELLRLDPGDVDGNVMLPRGARIAGVSAAPDERIMRLDVTGDDAGAHGGALRTIVVELLTNQWNALALANDERIAHVLRPRETKERALVTGDVYVAPAGRQRIGSGSPDATTGTGTVTVTGSGSGTGLRNGNGTGLGNRNGTGWPLALSEFESALRAVPHGERVQAFTRDVAYASPLNAAYVIGAAEHDDAALAGAHARYVTLLSGPRQPCLLGPPFSGQPYGIPLDTAAHACDSLMDAFARAVGPPPEAEDASRAAALENAQLQARRARGKVKRLRAQLEEAPREAAALRMSADLLLAQVHRVPKGAAQAALDDFAGGTVDVALDSTLSAVENATAFYTQARKRERAAARLPRMIAEAGRLEQHWQDIAERIERGAASAADIDAAQPKPPQHSRRAREQVSLPYRVHHTSSGLEVRVGRGSKGNDALTLHHSHGNDIWLHARDVGGAHVILRWQDAKANPPQRDLLEAAALAALNSKARTSKIVPVDWTRRKYVRKPRKSPPGRVTFERGKTVFVEPARRDDLA